MNLQNYVKLLRTRWVTITVTMLALLIGALALTALTTPLYQASTRLFVSTTGGSSVADTYQGNRFSQERVVSYAELLMGQTLAQRTIDKLQLDMRAEELQGRVEASAKHDTVLIDVSVLDESPVRARDVANALSDEFVSLVRELETPDDGSPPNARVIVEQRASIPADPVVPKTGRNIAGGFVLGILLGLFLAALRDRLDNSVTDRETLEAIAETGVVGSIPLDKERRKTPAISFQSDNSNIAEAFRKLRTNLQFLAVDHPPRAILVTSSMPSEGKSTTAINIALTLAESGHSVVLIDGDLRKPSLHNYLNLIKEVGLSTVLSGQALLTDALQATTFERLTALTSGAIPPNPSELLGSQAARNLFNELRAKFDYVIIDSSPLLAVTDAAILSSSADGVLVIARYGHTKRDQLEHAVGTLRDVQATVLGTIFTLIPSRGNSAYRYSYTYGEVGPKPSQSHRQAKMTRPTPAGHTQVGGDRKHVGPDARQQDAESADAHSSQPPRQSK